MIVGIVYKLDFDIEENPCFDIDTVSEALFEVDGVCETNTTGAQTSFDITVEYSIQKDSIDAAMSRDLAEIHQELEDKLSEGLDRCFRGDVLFNNEWYSVEGTPTQKDPRFMLRQNLNHKRVVYLSRYLLVETIQETREQRNKN